MAQSSHAMEKVNLRDSESVAKSREDNYDRYRDSDRWDKRKPRPFNKRDRQSWKRPSGFGGGNWRNGRENQRSRPNTNALIRDSTNLQEAKPIIFDLSSGRSKMELNDWFKDTAPSKLRRSDGVGWIYILAENITEKDKRDLFETYEGVVALRQEWSKIHDDPSIQVTFETFKDLAQKHDCKLGKWILHSGLIDDIWQNLALAFAYDRFPKGTIALKVSPVDENEPSGSNNHAIQVINRDMTDENEIIGVERTIRNVSIRSDLQYKPNIYTELGIYRNNRFGIRPTVYKSMIKRVGEDSGFEITNLAKEEWVYRYNPDPVAVQMTSEQDTNIKDANEISLEDIQAKMVLLREAMDNVDEAVKSFVKQQGKEKKKKNKKKAGKKGDGEVNGKNEIVEGDSVGKNEGMEGDADGKKVGKKTDGDADAKNEGMEGDVDDKKAGKKTDGDADDKNEGKEGEAIAEVCKDMVDEALAFLGKLGDADDKKVGKKGDGEVDGKNEIVEGDSVGKNEGMEGEADGKKVGKKTDGDVDGKKVEKKSDGDADGKNDGKEGEAITEDCKDMVDEAQP